jgi:hypothetical protein
MIRVYEEIILAAFAAGAGDLQAAPRRARWEVA